MEQNEKVNGELLDSLLGHISNGDENGLAVDASKTSPIEDISEYEIPENASTVDLSVSRWVITPEQIDWDGTDLAKIEEVRKVLIADRFNLIVTEDRDARYHYADMVLNKTNAIEKGLGIFIDYDDIRQDCDKFEQALLAISDCITIYDWLKSQIRYIEYCKLNNAALDELSSVLENDNINTVAELEKEEPKDPYVDYVPEDPNVRDALADSLISSFMDDHTTSGLLE